MSSAFLALGLVIALAAFLGAWAYFFRLPLILAYIITGIVVGPFLSQGSSSNEVFLVLRDLGLTFLLFLVGLEININELKQFGKKAISIGVIQVSSTVLLGFLFSVLLGFSFLASFYVAIALTFSSTVIVVKLLNEKRDYDSLYGKFSVAILLIQDLFAILFLIIIAGLKPGESSISIWSLLITVLSGAFLFGLIHLLNQKILPYLFERLARNTELLFLSSLAWMFIVVAAAAGFQFSLEIGAFIAGLGLASLKQEHQIAARIRPLRDFFLVIFFIVLGSHIIIDFDLSLIGYAIAFSVFVLLLKPLVLVALMGRFGFRRRTGFMTGISLAQVSEFSLIIVFLGLKNGVIDESLVEVIALTALITIAVSSYALVFATKIYKHIDKYLKVFETGEAKVELRTKNDLENHVVLIGCDRLGTEILRQLQKTGEQILVIDFNPTIINLLKGSDIDYLYGDITDPDIWEVAKVDKASLVISTVFDPEDTKDLLSNISTLHSKPIVFVTAADKDSAISFYEQGADYVIIPRILSGHQVAHLLTEKKFEAIKSGELRGSHLAELKETALGSTNLL